MRALTTFGRNDLRSIRRDSLMLYILLMPWIIILLLRLIIPNITTWLLNSSGFDLVPYYPLLLSIFIVLQIPVLLGLVFGLLILDERDGDILTALRVTPVSLGGYITYRIGIATVLSILYILVLAPSSGMMAVELLPALVPVALVASLLAPLVLLIVVVFAANKLEGLALMKGMGILFLGPMAAYFIESNWQLLFGVLPTYWAARAFWVINEGGAGTGLYLLVGVVFQAGLLAILVRRFGKLAYTT